MGYELSYICPCVAKGYCFGSYLCPSIVAAIVYEKLFSEGEGFSFLSFLFGLIFVRFAAYSIRRKVIEILGYQERLEESFLKAICCVQNSLIQDIYEMEIKRVGIYRNEPNIVVEETRIAAEPGDDEDGDA